jgi:hypothetical protein
VQERGDVTSTLRYGYYLNRQPDGPIDDKISAYREEEYRMVSKVFALVTDTRCTPDSLKRIEQFSYPAISGVDVVFGDVLPDVFQIQVGSSLRT